MAEQNENEIAATSEQREASGAKPVPVKKISKKKTPKKKTTGKPAIHFLTAEEILGADDIKEEELRIDEWGGTVIVRGLTSVDHEKLVQSSMEGPMGARQFNMVGYQAKLTVLCAYNGLSKDGGKRIFEDKMAPMLMRKASGPIAAIATKAQNLSGIGKAALDELKANLGQTPSGDSVFG